MHNMIFFISEHLILSSIWFFFLIIMIFLTVKNYFLKFKFINNFEAIKLINKQNAIVIDTRSLENFKKGHIVNSINIPLKKISFKSMEEIQRYKLHPVILIFQTTHEYQKYVTKFIKYGFKNILVLKNGIHDWTLDHLPLITKEK